MLERCWIAHRISKKFGETHSENKQKPQNTGQQRTQWKLCHCSSAEAMAATMAGPRHWTWPLVPRFRLPPGYGLACCLFPPRWTLYCPWFFGSPTFSSNPGTSILFAKPTCPLQLPLQLPIKRIKSSTRDIYLGWRERGQSIEMDKII